MAKLKPKSISELKKAIAEFKTLKSEKQYSVIHSKFFELFNIFPMIVTFAEIESLKHLPLFRSCPADKVVVRGKQNIRSYMGPPKNAENGNQRANWNGRNVFYAGDSPFVTVVENKKVQEGNEYFVGRWELDLKKIDSSEIPISIMTLNNLPANNPWSRVVPTETQWKKKLMDYKNIDERQVDLHIEFMKELSTLFVDDNEDYNLSAFIADSILYNNTDQKHVPKLMIYPSIESNRSGCNFAIHPDFANEYLRLVKVLKIKVSEISANGFTVNYNSIGQVELNKVQFYHFNTDKARAVYEIDSFECACGHKFEIKNPERLNLMIDRTQMNLKMIIDRELPNRVQEELLLSQPEDQFQTLDIPYEKIMRLTIPISNASYINDGERHESLFCSIKIHQPFDYIKENHFRFGMPPLVPNNWKPLGSKCPPI